LFHRRQHFATTQTSLTNQQHDNSAKPRPKQQQQQSCLQTIQNHKQQSCICLATWSVRVYKVMSHQITCRIQHSCAQPNNSSAVPRHKPSRAEAITSLQNSRDHHTSVISACLACNSAHDHCTHCLLHMTMLANKQTCQGLSRRTQSFAAGQEHSTLLLVTKPEASLSWDAA
jgi:hypothetical protein